MSRPGLGPLGGIVVHSQCHIKQTRLSYVVINDGMIAAPLARKTYITEAPFEGIVGCLCRATRSPVAGLSGGTTEIDPDSTCEQHLMKETRG